MSIVLLAADDFDEDRAPGAVIGSRARCGGLRKGADVEDALSVDHGRLRIRSLHHGGWGRAVLAYGPFERRGTLLLAATLLNGLTTSQSDVRPEGELDRLRRWWHTLPHGSIRRPQLRDNLFVGWFTRPRHRRPAMPVAALVNRAGSRATGELWFQVGERRVLVEPELQNLPVTYLVSLADGVARLHGWSLGGAPGLRDPERDAPLAEVPAASAGHPRHVFAAIQQVVLGEVGYRVDTRVDTVRVARAPADAVRARALIDPAFWDPVPDLPTVADALAGPAGELVGTGRAGAPAWRRVMGAGRIDRRGDGSAEVRASREHPNPGRTAYCLPWTGEPVAVTTTVIPPGRRRGEGHRGRSGIVLWQDAGNHLVVNHFLDDASVGVSISAFLRTGGHEQMYDWDAVWSNVGDRIRFGVSFELAVACDGRQFLCRVDGQPVLHRWFTDYRPTARPLELRCVGLVANWEWGDDTGTRFRGFTAAPLRAPASRAARHASAPGTNHQTWEDEHESCP